MIAPRRQDWSIRGREWRFAAATDFLIAAACALLVAACSSNKVADQLADTMQLKPGMVVADVGAGSGEKTVVFARRVGPGGHVFATEIDPVRLAKLQELVQHDALTNVTIVTAGEHQSGLPPKCCDAILLSGVYHHLTDPAGVDASLYDALRPGGELAIYDFRPTILLAMWTPKGIPANRGGHGVNPDIVNEELTHAGFKLETKRRSWSQRPPPAACESPAA